MLKRITKEVKEFNIYYKNLKKEVMMELKEEHPEYGFFEWTLYHITMFFAKVMLIIKIVKGER